MSKINWKQKIKLGDYAFAIIMNLINIVIFLVWLLGKTLLLSVVVLFIDILGIAASAAAIKDGEKKVGIINLILFSVAALVSFGFFVFSIIALLAKMGILFSS